MNWQSRANNAFVSLTGPISVGNEAIITAHEIGHILTNGGHYTGENQLLNIMLDGASVKDEDNEGVETAARPKRFFDEQETLIRGHHLAN